MQRLAHLALAALVAAGCSLLPSPAPSDYDIVVANGTTLDLAIRVNDKVARVFTAGDSGLLSAATLGSLPWTVEAVTSSGRVVTSMAVTPGSSGCADRPANGAISDCHGVLVLVDLSCGRLVMHTNATTPELPAPMPGAGEPGDCEP